MAAIDALRTASREERTPSPLSAELTNYAKSIGFSPNVARRLATLRPNVLQESMNLDPATNAALRRAYLVSRGLNNVTLKERVRDQS